MKAPVGEREIACLRPNKEAEGTIREQEKGMVEMHGLWGRRGWGGARICLLASIRAVLLCLIAAK